MKEVVQELLHQIDVIPKYNAMLAESEREIARLMAERDLWMARSNAHAMEADRLREERLNLKAKLWEATKSGKS